MIEASDYRFRVLTPKESQSATCVGGNVRRVLLIALGLLLSCQSFAEQKPLTVNGILTGMTLEQAKAVIPDLTCTSSVVRGYHVTGCHPASQEPSMSFGLYRGRVYAIQWHCENSSEGCDAVPKQMDAHLGKPRTDRTEVIKAQTGAFREHVIRWRLSNEGAIFNGEVLSVLNYALAPQGESSFQFCRANFLGRSKARLGEWDYWRRWGCASCFCFPLSGSLG